jgi:LacI family transcriptional regulator
MQDVAEAAGLSRFTVSKVLNGTPGVSEKTRALVLNACQKLNFVANQHAASLAKGGARLMGILVTSIVDPFYGQIIETAEHAASALGFDLAYRCSYGDAQHERRIAHAFLGLKASALIVSAASGDDNREFWRSLSQQLPVVFIDHDLLDASHVVMTDHYLGGCLVTEHLLGQGAPPAYLGSSQPLSNTAIFARQKGYLDAMASARKPALLIDTAAVEERRDTERFGYAAMQRHLQNFATQALPGVACATDAIALGAMKALTDAGRLPGRDVLVTGHDDLPFGAFVNPSLTTVRQPKSAIGQQAVQTAVKLATAKDFRRVAKMRAILTPELVVRGSTSG